MMSVYYLVFSIFQIQRKYVLSYPIDPLYFVGDETWGDFICRGGVTIKDNSECVDACKKLGLTSDGTNTMKMHDFCFKNKIEGKCYRDNGKLSNLKKDASLICKKEGNPYILSC